MSDNNNNNNEISSSISINKPVTSNPRAVTVDKTINDKKKKAVLTNWDKLRGNIMEYSDSSLFNSSPSIASTPNITKINTTKPYQQHKMQVLNPFIRSTPLDNPNIASDSKPTLVNATLVAAQAAGMNNFVRNIRPPRHQNGVIYAASTAVQQDIYRLERDLEKIFSQLMTRSQYASFAEPVSKFSSTAPVDNYYSTYPQPPPSFGKKSMFQKQSVADLFHNTTTTLNTEVTSPVKDDVRQESTKVSTAMTMIMDSMKKYKAATRLPLTSEILAILATPFDRSVLIVSDCDQALNTFEYIINRFTQLDSIEHFEQLMFCCRLLGTSDLRLKKRVFQILNSQLLPCNEDSSYLPSTPQIYHSLVYTLTHALVRLSFNKANTQSDMKESGINESEPDEDTIQNFILTTLDKLANGTLIPPTGDAWKKYHSSSSDDIPTSVSKLCVAEALCKCIMLGICSQSDPYNGPLETTVHNAYDRARDTLILLELLPRYWSQPTGESKPGQLKVLFLLSEAACESFLMAGIEDLKSKHSIVSAFLQFLIERVQPTSLQPYLADRKTQAFQNTVTQNIIAMIFSLLSVCSLEEPSSGHLFSDDLSSPALSPRPSIHDFSSENLSLEAANEYQSILSSSTNPGLDTGLRKIRMAIKTYVEDFWRAGYREDMLQCAEAMHDDAAGERFACIYQNLVFCLDPAMGDEIVKRTLPALFKRLVESCPPAFPTLSHLLSELSKRYKTYFYKPLVSCVASDNEEKVSERITLITCLRRYMSGVKFWMQDAEMINVLLLSDVGKSKKQESGLLASPGSNKTEAQWGHTTLGQCAVAAEFMWTLKDLRRNQKNPERNMEEDEIAKKFLIDLERRLSVFLTAKEKMSLLPLPLRIILCNIFSDIRFFCNTTHRPGWLARAIDWATQPIMATPEHAYQHVLPNINPDESPTVNNPYADNKLPLMHTGHLAEASIMFQRIHNMYFKVTEQLYSESTDMSEYGGHLAKFGDNPIEGHLDATHTSRFKRYHTIHSMYPITRVAALSLDLKPANQSNLGQNTNADSEKNEGPALKMAKYRFEHMEDINQNPYGSVFSLLAAVYTTLSSQEFSRLVKPLWEFHMDDRKPQSFIPAVFLLMECAEKIPKTMIEVCTHDFYSGDPLRRLAVIQKHSSLSAFRFNVLSQEYIPISSRKRPFKGDGGAFSTPFVPTDLGSNQFSLDEPRWMSKLKNASNFPIELKRQIQELGWDDDDNGEEHEALKKVLTPLGLLPSLFLEEEELINEDDNPMVMKQNGKKIDVSKLISRRKRATTVHSLTIAFLSMVDLLTDDFGGTSNALRELLEYFLRDDPSLFLRAFLSDLGKFKLDRHRDMLTRIKYLVSMQHKLPPQFTHILFNYLAGMLKWLARENRKKDGLILMTLIHPILAELILSTNDLTIRELRKNKIEHLLVSTGRFWFTHEQPIELFPRYPTSQTSNFTLLDIQPEVFYVAMLRISHIQFLTNYLVRYPREVYAVKKTLQDYEPIPNTESSRTPIWASDETYFPDITRRKRRSADSYIYHREEDTANSTLQDINDRGFDDLNPITKVPNQRQTDTETLSALRARIWLRFIDILLNGLNKNYNDRDELDNILQGINVIITEHDRDFGIIGQALILYTRVVTRFKRLFVSNRGYTTFLPALFKVFCEVDCFPQVRSAIVFAWCRFYAVHEESFVFQMLGTLIPTILNAYKKSDELGSWMIDNLFLLMQAMHDPPHLGATSDVLGLQLQVELDDHERGIQERIDAVSNPMTMPLSTTIFKPLARGVTTPITPLDITNYNNRPFELQSFIKLFLTIIAYDPGSLRAEQFVKTFRHLMSRFHKLKILKSLIDEGITALIDVFTKFSKHAKVTITTVNQNASNVGYQGVSSNADESRLPGANARTESAQQAYGKQWQQNDKLTVRMEFVLLVNEYLKYDGTLSEVDHGKMAFIIRSVIRDYGNIKGLILKTDWIKDYLVDCFRSMIDLKNYIKPFKKLLNQIFSQYRSQSKTMESSDLYDGLAIVLEQGQGKPMNLHDVAGFINEKFVAHGLNLVAQHNWENNTKEFNRFCNSLARLIIAIMENSTEDVLGAIEQQLPTPGLIGYIIIPICFQYNLQWNYSNVSVPTRYRPDPTGNWTRLLNYISKACSQASLLKIKSSVFSLSHLTSSMGQEGIDTTEFAEIKDRNHTPQSIALLFSLSFVAMKIILVRGFQSFNKLKGSWIQVGYFIKTALVFGQTLKYLKPKSGRSTPIIPSTPVMGGLSPGVPASAGLPTGNIQSTPDTRTSFSFTAPLGNTTIYDFTTWRFLEFVTCFRCPLYVYLKDFMQEKLLQLSGHSPNRNSFYAPPSSSGRGSVSFSLSGPFGNSPAAPTPGENTSGRWKSWGGNGGSSIRKRGKTQQQQQQQLNTLSSIGIIPQVNIQDTDAMGDDHSNRSEGSPTYGLGLHIPGKSTANHSIPGSPSHSFNTHYEFSDTESGSIPPGNIHSPTGKQDKARPSSSTSIPGGQGLFNTSQRDNNASNVMHILHAETITSIIHVQLSMGFKPALPWMATKRQDLRPWNPREAIAKLSSEWEWLLLLYAETDMSLVKMNSTNNNPPNTPLL